MNRTFVFSSFVLSFMSFQGSLVSALASNAAHPSASLHIDKGNASILHSEQASSEKPRKMDACVDEYPCS